jgi:hypothetical protein
MGKFGTCITNFQRLEMFVKSFVEGSSSLAQTLFLAVRTSELVTPAFFVFVFVVGITVR